MKNATETHPTSGPLRERRGSAAPAALCALATLGLATNAAADWPLPVPKNIVIESLADLPGVLFLTESQATYQIEQIVWQILPDGDVDIYQFSGYASDGTRIDVQEKGLPRGIVIEHPDDFTGFRLGDPEDAEDDYLVHAAELGTDGEGYLKFVQLMATNLTTGEPVFGGGGTESCGLRVEQGCRASNCGGACGGSPSCPCSKDGACDGHIDSVCSGSCSGPLVCNGSVESCSCIQIDTPDPDPDDG